MREQAKQDFDAIAPIVSAATRALGWGDLSPKTEYLVEELLGHLRRHNQFLKAVIDGESLR